MSKRTKKVGSAGRLGPRYGRKIRMRTLEVEKKQKIKYKCPYCKRDKLKRIAPGIWKCIKCLSKFSGGCYTP